MCGSISSLDNARRVVTVLEEFGFPPETVCTEMITDGKKSFGWVSSL